MKVAYVHDWLVTYRGGEKVLDSLLELYPEAPVYTLFYDPEQMPPSINRRTVIFPKWLGPLRRFRKLLLPILPHVMESFPLEDYDLVISSSSCVAKGVITAPDAYHVCYLHSPMRYVWDQRSFYLAGKPALVRGLIHFLSCRLRSWDVASAQRIDRIIANSRFVAKRVHQYYNLRASVANPPVPMEDFLVAKGEKGDYFLVAGAFVPYKRFDLAIKACNKLGIRLVVAGSGPLEAELRSLAGPTVEFQISPPRSKWVALMRGAKALIFPGVEDFGMIAIEAFAAGTPVIALERGGALDFMEAGKTGLLFDTPSVSSLVASLEGFDSGQFSEGVLRDHALGFSKRVFMAKFQDELDALINKE